VIFLLNGLTDKLETLLQQCTVFGLWVPIVLCNLGQALVDERVAKFLSLLLSEIEGVQSLGEIVVLCVRDALEEEEIVPACWIAGVSKLLQCHEVVKGIEELVLAEVCVGPERVQERADLLVKVLLSCQVVQVLYPLSEFFLHNGGGALCKYSQLFDDALVHLQSGGSLESVTCPIVVSKLYLELAHLI
jgi:hypothetical protein